MGFFDKFETKGERKQHTTKTNGKGNFKLQEYLDKKKAQRAEQDAQKTEEQKKEPKKTTSIFKKRTVDAEKKPFTFPKNRLYLVKDDIENVNKD